MASQSAAQGETTAPVLTMEPPWVRFLAGDSIILTCDAGRSSRSKNYIWHISDRGDIPGEERYPIKYASKNDTGVYKCKTTTDSSRSSTPYSNTIHVNVTEPDGSTTIESLPEILWANQNLLLRCNFTFKKEAIYTFFKEGSRLGEATVFVGSGTFEIERVSVEDKGRYRCELQFVNFTNGPIYSSAYTFVDIKDLPVRLSVKPDRPKDGDNITLSCECSDSDACGSGEYSFYRNNSLMNSDSVSHNVYHIRQATVMDSGWYHCSVSNSLTHTAKSVEMTVRVPVSCPDFFSVWGNSTFAIGARARLGCKSEQGTPPIHYLLSRDSQIIDNRTVTNARRGDFTLTVMSVADGGLYSCGADNGFGRMDQCGQPMRLTIAVSPERFLFAIYAAVGISLLILALLILLFLYKRRRHNKEHTVPSAGEIVYAEVQVKRKADGHNGKGAGTIPGKDDYYVTYATLKHQKMERNGDLLPRQEEEDNSSDYGEIYQNVRRS
ncbi:Fc receptor-like protein 5 isoform X2 [Scyliorhinus canicula]|nr:Fc receptor-like protein 5 isoform X2 [Scyliorhinus canicula]